MNKYKTSKTFNIENSKYPIHETAFGIRVDAPVKDMKLYGTQRPNGSYRRQCAEFVNDAIGIPSFFTDLLRDKQKRITTTDPSVGSVAILNSAQPYGHVILVEEDFGNGKYTFAESNYDGKESFLRWKGTVEDLKSRGLLGFTEGLEQVSLVSEWALDAVAWAKTKEIHTWNNPQEKINEDTVRHTFHKLGLLSKTWQVDQYKNGIINGHMTKEQLIYVLYNIIHQ